MTPILTFATFPQVPNKAEIEQQVSAILANRSFTGTVEVMVAGGTPAYAEVRINRVKGIARGTEPSSFVEAVREALDQL